MPDNILPMEIDSKHPAHDAFTLKAGKNNRLLGVQATDSGYDAWFYLNDKITGMDNYQGLVRLKIDKDITDAIYVGLESVIAKNLQKTSGYVTDHMEGNFERMQYDSSANVWFKTTDRYPLSTGRLGSLDFKLSSEFQIEQDGIRFALRRYDGKSDSYTNVHFPSIEPALLGFDVNWIRETCVEPALLDASNTPKEKQFDIYKHVVSTRNLEEDIKIVALIKETNDAIRLGNVRRALQIIESKKIPPKSSYFSADSDSDFRDFMISIAWAVDEQSFSAYELLFRSCLDQGYINNSHYIGKIYSTDIFRKFLERLIPYEPWKHNDFPTLDEASWYNWLLKTHFNDLRGSSDDQVKERIRTVEQYHALPHRKVISQFLKKNLNYNVTLDYLIRRAKETGDAYVRTDSENLNYSTREESPIMIAISYGLEREASWLVREGFYFDALSRRRALDSGMMEVVSEMDCRTINSRVEAKPEESQARRPTISRSSL